MAKEARVRIKIYRLLEKAGWRFFDDEQALVNANRELTVRFEKKIQATLARVWGGE